MLIVLLVSFFSLGLRTGLVVALSIPLVLALTFAAMKLFGIDLHKISLGALVLALGLLVDDAIIAVEMMAIKMEQGLDRMAAAAFAYSSTAFPMLTGTLITAAGFLPIATAKSGTGEYTRSIFQVVTIALLISWFAAVILIPYLGYTLLPRRDGDTAPRPPGAIVQPPALLAQASRPRCCRPACAMATIAPTTKKLHTIRTRRRSIARFRALVDWCVAIARPSSRRPCRPSFWSMVGFGFVQQQFFPDSTRPELMVDLKLTEGASLTATRNPGQEARGLARQASGTGELRQLRRLRRAALLPAARPATAAGQLRRVRAADQEHWTIARSCAPI